MSRLVLAVAALIVAAVIAGGAGASGGPVFVEEGFECGLQDGDGNFHVTTDSFVAVYSSGRVYLRCEASGLPNSSGSVVTFNFANTGGLCGLGPAGATDTWRNRISRLGTSQLTCTGFIKLNGDDQPDLSGARAAGFGLAG